MPTKNWVWIALLDEWLMNRSISERLVDRRSGFGSAWTEKDEERFKEALALAQEARRRVEAHDPQTQEHGTRVAQWAILMAARLPGFDRRRLRRLEIAALLHDYGKLMIPASILNKPGKLDEHEWELVRKHPVIGAMSAPVHPDFVNKDAILWHHKRFDGGGYPEGNLKGTKIPLEARITSVADVFDAVASNRAYHEGGKGLPPNRALEVLEKAASSALDPTLVALFRTIVGETTAGVGSEVGYKTLVVTSVIQTEVARARKALREEIGPFDASDPFGGLGPPPGLEDKVVKSLVRATLDEESARNVVRYVFRLPLRETFSREDLAMSDSELKAAIQKAGNHQEAILYLRPERARLAYHSIVVFMGELWLCAGEEVGDRTQVMLIR